MRSPVSRLRSIFRANTSRAKSALVCPIWLITNAGDAPASYSSDANVRRSVWFVTPSAIGGTSTSARAAFAVLTAGGVAWRHLAQMNCASARLCSAS